MSRRGLFLSLSLLAGFALLGGGFQALGQRSQGAQKAAKGKRRAARKKSQKAKAKRGRRAQFEIPPTAAESDVPVLSSGDSYDDFASVTQTGDGTFYAAYHAYYDGHDQVRIHKRLANGRWSTRSYVPLVRANADIWAPQLASDADGRVWVIWSEQTGQSESKSGNWDLYARALIGEEWGPIVRLTDDPKPDINHHVATDSKGNIFVVWQAHPQNYGVVRLCKWDGSEWSKPLAVTSGTGSDWYPQVAVDREGVAWIAFDSYRNGDYDVFLTSVDGEKVGDVVPIATSKYYEAHATVACTPDGRVWVAWEQGGFNWGKNQGYWLRIQNKNQGTALGSGRTVHVVAYKDGRTLAAPAVGGSMPDAPNSATAMAALAADAQGRLWLRFRQRRTARRGRRRFAGYWVERVTALTPNGWSQAALLPGSTGRISVFSRILPAKDGSLVIAYSGDQRGPANFHQPIHDQVLVSSIAKPDSPPRAPALEPYEPPAPPEQLEPWNVDREREQVARIRDFRATIDGKPNRIVRGDLHRHTELSWDVGPGNDGSYLDFYRYMIDVAAMDFGGPTDHQGGGHYAYHWWLTEKSCDMYYLPPRYVPLYSYERSVRYPNGHRNVFHAYRGVPVFPFQLKLDQTGVFPGVGTGAVLENDTKLLYQALHKSGGIAISHTSGTSSMGTDWRDNDPEIEPVVEIYQGARNSYEALGAPRVHGEDKPPNQAPGGFQKLGLVWNAYAKGYRLGTVSASDHGSTHISYALVYTPENDRQAIVDSIRKRHTYGATDNIIVQVAAAGQFMGDEFKTGKRPTLDLHVEGTANVAQIDLVRDNKYVYTAKPGERRVELQYVDMQPNKGTSLYYFRILQEDGEVAWASPMWINYQPD